MKKQWIPFLLLFLFLICVSLSLLKNKEGFLFSALEDKANITQNEAASDAFYIQNKNAYNAVYSSDESLNIRGFRPAEALFNIAQREHNANNRNYLLYYRDDINNGIRETLLIIKDTLTIYKKLYPTDELIKLALDKLNNDYIPRLNFTLGRLNTLIGARTPQENVEYNSPNAKAARAAAVSAAAAEAERVRIQTAIQNSNNIKNEINTAISNVNNEITKLNNGNYSTGNGIISARTIVNQNVNTYYKKKNDLNVLKNRDPTNNEILTNFNLFPNSIDNELNDKRSQIALYVQYNSNAPLLGEPEPALPVPNNLPTASYEHINGKNGLKLFGNDINRRTREHGVGKAIPNIDDMINKAKESRRMYRYADINAFISPVAWYKNTYFNGTSPAINTKYDEIVAIDKNSIFE